jgi:hypothetical protein
MPRRKRMRLVRSAEAGLWIFQHPFGVLQARPWAWDLVFGILAAHRSYWKLHQHCTLSRTITQALVSREFGVKRRPTGLWPPRFYRNCYHNYRVLFGVVFFICGLEMEVD